MESGEFFETTIYGTKRRVTLKRQNVGAIYENSVRLMGSGTVNEKTLMAVVTCTNDAEGFTVVADYDTLVTWWKARV